MSGQRRSRWWNAVATLAVVSLVATAWVPSAGVALFMLTTIVAVTHYREMPVLALLVVTATLFAAVTLPASFLPSHPAGTSVRPTAKP
jgi:hypothetical protein